MQDIFGCWALGVLKHSLLCHKAFTKFQKYTWLILIIFIALNRNKNQRYSRSQMGNDTQSPNEHVACKPALGLYPLLQTNSTVEPLG